MVIPPLRLPTRSAAFATLQIHAPEPISPPEAPVLGAPPSPDVVLPEIDHPRPFENPVPVREPPAPPPPAVAAP